MTNAGPADEPRQDTSYSNSEGDSDADTSDTENGAAAAAPAEDANVAALFDAVIKGDISQIELLLKSVDINHKYKNGYTPLIMAAAKGQLEVVKFLIANKANVAEKNSYGDSALMLATWFGHKEVVDLLLQNGGNLAERNSWGNTLLMLAAGENRAEVAELLLDKYTVDLTEVHPEGVNALHVSAIHGDKEVIDLLLKRGADIDRKDEKGGNTPLIFAVSYKQRKMVKFLVVEKKAILSKRNNAGLTAVLEAVKKGDIKIARWLLNKGAEIDDVSAEGNTLFHFAAMLAIKIKDQKNFLNFLWDKKKEFATKPPIDSQNSMGLTALIMAAKCGNTAIVEWFYKHGCEINKVSFQGTALALAAENGHLDTVKWLLEHGAKDISTNILKGSTLSWAANNGELEVVKLLLEYNASNIDEKTGPGSLFSETALETAATKGHTEIVQCLLEHGAKAGIEEALSRAKSAGYKDMVRLLEKYTDKPPVVDTDAKVTPETAGSAQGTTPKEVVRAAVDLGITADMGGKTTEKHVIVSSRP